jgi:hypothetical protein
MTSGRCWSPCVTWAVSLALLGSTGCGGGSTLACTECPPLEGLYALELEEELPAACAGLGVRLPRGPLEVERTGSRVSAFLDGLRLDGTLYVTYDFNLVGVRTEPADGGAAGPALASLHGRYIPALGDGGVPRLVGTWQAEYEGTVGGQPRRCTVARSFTALRQ